MMDVCEKNLWPFSVFSTTFKSAFKKGASLSLFHMSESDHKSGTTMMTHQMCLMDHRTRAGIGFCRLQSKLCLPMVQLMSSSSDYPICPLWFWHMRSSQQLIMRLFWIKTRLFVRIRTYLLERSIKLTHHPVKFICSLIICMLSRVDVRGPHNISSRDSKFTSIWWLLYQYLSIKAFPPPFPA